ncbi:MAG: hypothetical protein OEZ29_06630 [Candidatus Bathyarchaeota archaeon]|nr:hypothetical protein [Candidatus Bathyarchaeota archaeon]MDH5780255.1 hypothetical protein [Candidatus Bathyarchaeota archaeon]
MKGRTKRQLKFYLSLAGLATLTIVTGIVFIYIAWLAWAVERRLALIRFELFATMAAILFIMCIADIFLFFRLIIKRRY